MNFTIGLSGLQVAQRAIEVVGTNIANVSTEGYHRQEVVVEPLATDHIRGIPTGGASIKGYYRAIDTLLEGEILSQHPQYGQVSQELASLQALQASLGDLTSGGLTSALNRFFGALRELATDPASQALREQAVWAADSLASTFRHLGGVMQDLDEHVVVEARNMAEQVNHLATEIADLNQEIEIVLMRGGNPNLAIDRRDQAILDLAEMVDVTVSSRQDGGAVNVLAWGTPLVTGSKATTLVVAPIQDGKLGLAVEGALGYDSDIRGGEVGGLFSLRNELLSDVSNELDALARTIIQEVNRLHVQGVGSAGSFDELTGSRIADPDATLDKWNWPISAGTLQLRLIGPDGSVTRHTIYVDPETDTLKTVAAALNAIDPAHFSASVVDQRLHLEGKAGYEFDFLPAAHLDLGTPWTGSSMPTESGIYNGAQNDTYTFTVQGDGTVGVTAGLAVEVRNGAGGLVATLDVGNAYAPGTAMAVENGLEMAFAAGTLTDGEQFAVKAIAKPAPDFVMSTPWNGSSTPAVSGIYTGPANDTFTFTVGGNGEIGVTENLTVEVRNGAGELVTTLEVGHGYAAGDTLEVYQGLQVAFERGTLVDGQQFGIQALVDSDPSGFLAAAGINTLFEGTSAVEMTLRPEILGDPRRLATAQGADMADNTLLRKLADLGEQQMTGLNGASPADAFRLLVTGVGQKISLRQARQDALESVLQQLEDQKDRISGVDINEEAAKLLVFERMFQGMAKVLSTQQKAMQVLIDLL